MPISHKSIFIKEDGSFMQLTQKKFDDLTNMKPDANIPEFANKTIKHALFIYETENRKPVRILSKQYARFKFDKDGFIDMLHHMRQIPRHSEIFDDKPELKEGNIISAETMFEKKRFKGENFWIPSLEMEDDLLRLIFKKK